MLNILNVSPANQSQNINIDQKITIEFNQDIDPFTVSNGVILYIPNNELWIGSEASILDTKYTNILDLGTSYSIIPFNYTITNTALTITPDSLLPNLEHFIAILPGNDATRYLSTLTTDIPAYTRIGNSTATLNILSAYSGLDSAIFRFEFSDSTHFTLYKDNTLVGSFTFAQDTQLSLPELQISITGQFDTEDIVTLDVIPASGLESVFRTSFTTSQYETLTPVSEDIELNLIAPLEILETQPADYSVNNIKCNPVTIKFNRNLKTNQVPDIDIYKTDMDTDQIKKVSYYYKISDNILKLYLTQVES